MEEEEKVKESLMINPLAYPEEKFTEDGKSYYYTRGDGTPITNESWSLKDLAYPLNVPFGGKRQGNLSDWSFTNWLVNAAPGQLAPIGAAAKGIKTMRNQHRKSPHGFYKEGSVDVKKANEILDDVLINRTDKIIPKYSSGPIVQTTEGTMYRPTPGTMQSTFESRYADELDISHMTYDQLKNELESRSEGLGYKVSDVKLNKRRNQFGIDNNISSLYLGHAEAYADSIKDGTKTLEYFPTAIWGGKRFRPKVKNLKGRRYVYFDDYLKRRSNRKLGKSRRDQRIWKQTPEGTPPGTFYREKLAQLRKLNEEELAAGLPRTKLREVDMDHKNALRSVEIYTEGLNKDNEKIVFDLMEQYGLFRGDDARNLILRKKSVHKDLWPKLKKQLKKLNHKTRKDFSTEGDYMLYLTVWKNPKTGSTPLREYIETIKFVEEQAAIKTVEEVERILKKSTPNIIAKSPMRDKLIDILGGLESYKSFMKRLMQYPADVRKDMIEAEFGYIGSSDQVDPERLDDLLNEALPD